MKELTDWPGWEKFLSDNIIMKEPKDGEFNLYRGQPCSDSLLPKIARKDPKFNTHELEKKMLATLRLRGSLFLTHEDISDLDLLAIAQHHGMATRLLDWTTNPLVALWFACINTKNESNAHFYIYRAVTNAVVDTSADINIFDISDIRIFRPKLNSPRIIAQQGWFSLNGFQPAANSPTTGEGEFFSLDHHPVHFLWGSHVVIPEADKSTILRRLDKLGVNYESVFPDLDGICRYINWQNDLRQ